MFGFSFEKFIVIAVIAIVIVGPERLPAYAAAFAGFVVRLRRDWRHACRRSRVFAR